MVLADEHHIAVTRETTLFSVMLENLHSTIQGPVIDFPKFDIVPGLDWLQKNNPHVDWATSVLTIKCEGDNHQIYSDSVDQLLRNYVFVHITKTVNPLPPLALDKNVFPHCTRKSAHSPAKPLNLLKDLAHTVDERFLLAYPVNSPASTVPSLEETLVNLDYLLAWCQPLLKAIRSSQLGVATLTSKSSSEFQVFENSSS
ncbi:hypothetical protein DSO57_1035801 [Entomophthora muscae]|uniref:Uncharacterized protein n=1 Tax=Entomophthora muscae TaxID=34485 RepID=A0ACC2SCE3_9FUNG|nr:hypothetical protein DSO57_1035801 [Entomophthora muscae]